MRVQRPSYLVIMAGLVAAAMSVSFAGSARAAWCNEVWKPVCGTANGHQHTFTNSCWAKLAKATKVHKGECKWK